MPLLLGLRMVRTSCRLHYMRVVQAAALAAMLLPGASAAGPHLICEVSQGGATVTLEFSPVSDPYTISAANINGRFRFKAVMVGSEQKVDYISLYAYDLSSGHAVLLHEVKYVSPAPLRNAPSDSLTGKHYVYSSRLGREMEYGCALAEVD